ncbi:MAG: glycosyl hydrolase family 28-related protein, partial [Verrucomicrobiota bacterium]
MMRWFVRGFKGLCFGLAWLVGCGLVAEERFDVRDFGAVGDGVVDDTAAIRDAIEAAAKAGGGTVFFPEGTYNVMPQGRAVVTAYQKNERTWEKVAEPKRQVRLGEWHLSEGAPEDSEATRHLNLRTGDISTRTPEGWRVTGHLLEGAGEGWTSGLGEPRSLRPPPGSLYFDFHLKFDHRNAGIFELRPRHRNLTFLGESPERSHLSARTWGNRDPMDYEVDTEKRRI